MRSLMPALAALTLGLGGCAMVTSETPWLSPETGGARLKTGWWIPDEADCRAPRNDRPFRRWPACARDGAVLVRDGEILGMTGAPADVSWTARAYVVGLRAPVVLQMRDADEGTSYGYMGLEPVETDAEGRMTRVRGWSGLCGPDGFRAPWSEPTPEQTVERRLWPGLAWGEGKNSCTATSLAALQASIAASRTQEGNEHGYRWLREARTDDFAGGGR